MFDDNTSTVCIQYNVLCIVGGAASGGHISTTVVRTVQGIPAMLTAANGNAPVQREVDPFRLNKTGVNLPPRQSNGDISKPTEIQRELLLTEKPPVFTEPYHNENKFHLIFTHDYFKNSACRICWSYWNIILLE